MNKYHISYVYQRPSGGKISTGCDVSSESESGAKDIIKQKHHSRGETVCEWRSIKKLS